MRRGWELEASSEVIFVASVPRKRVSQSELGSNSTLETGWLILTIRFGTD